jgi:hypothetical protein
MTVICCAVITAGFGRYGYYRPVDTYKFGDPVSDSGLGCEKGEGVIFVCAAFGVRAQDG